MTDTSFEVLQKSIVTQLKGCFESSRSEVLKVESNLSEWTQKFQKLNKFRDEATLDNFIFEHLNLSSHNNLDEPTKKEILDSFRNLIKSYLDYIPHENFSKANETLEKIKALPLDSHASISEFIQLRTQLSQYLNDHRNTKLNKIQDQISSALKTTHDKLNEPSKDQVNPVEVDLESKQEQEAGSLTKSFSPNHEDLNKTVVRRYNIELTNQDLLNLKVGKSTSLNLVNLFVLFLNEREENGTYLFLKSDFIASLSENQEPVSEGVEKPTDNRLKTYSGGFNIAQNESIWNKYQGVVIPYSFKDGEWSVILVQNKGDIVNLLESGAENTDDSQVNEVIEKVLQHLNQGSHSGNEGHEEKNKYQLQRSSVDNNLQSVGSSRLLLWRIYRLIRNKEEEGESEYKENSIFEFSNKLLQTFLLIGDNNEGYLKFDELL